MIAALWANPNWDDTKEAKGHRKSHIEGINENYMEAIDAVELAFTSREVPEEEKLSDDNPFFQAAERGLEKVDQYIAQRTGGEQQRDPDKSEEEPEDIDMMKDVDQR